MDNQAEEGTEGNYGLWMNHSLRYQTVILY